MIHSSAQPNRRTAFKVAAASAALSLGTRRVNAVDTGPLETFVPCRRITHGPGHHWFGYYDKREFDPSGKRVLCARVNFEHRQPTRHDAIEVGYVDTADHDRWVPLGKSTAWCWQQGCMLQWRGPEGREVLWNDMEGERFVCRIHDVHTGKTRTLDQPIYTISEDGRWALSADFRRINNLRPGYGYTGLPDPHVRQRAPEATGIWRMDLETGRSDLLLSIAEIAKIAWPDGQTHDQAWHYFNHLLISPGSQRFVFLHRYRPEFDPETLQFRGNFITRMITADMDGKNPFVIDPSGQTSHFIWRGDEQICCWTRPAGEPNGFYLIDDHTGKYQPVGKGVMTVNGHNTYLAPPYDDWILNDTYPDRETGRQTLYLYNPKTNRRIDLGKFPSPSAYRDVFRCDLHPRSSADGLSVAIDSPHEDGRQVHLLDLRGVI